MLDSIVARYAHLLTHYCLEIKKGDRLLIQSTTLAEPLVREVYRFATRAGANVVTDLEWREQQRIFFQEAQNHQLEWISPTLEKAFPEFEAYLYIRAPYNLREDQQIDAGKRKTRSEATKAISQQYSVRTASRALKRCLCQYPTQASAQEAGMSLEEYEEFVYGACKLDDPDPEQSWLVVRKNQHRLVDFLNKADRMQFRNGGTDLLFRVKDRIWINSDGQTNMPSGEVYTTPLEDAVDGVIHFDYPSIFRGHPVEGITLEVKEGNIINWHAKIGKSLLDEIFDTKGARKFGEVAVGTNYSIKRPTKNILFDEKIGGTIHMAVGQSYFQTGGKNESSIHWDMIAEMKDGGEIWADGIKIYQDGQFLI